MTDINQQLDIYTAEVDYSAPAGHLARHPNMADSFPALVRRRNPRSILLFVSCMLRDHGDIIKEIRTYNPQGKLLETIKGEA